MGSWRLKLTYTLSCLHFACITLSQTLKKKTPQIVVFGGRYAGFKDLKERNVSL